MMFKTTFILLNTHQPTTLAKLSAPGYPRHSSDTSRYRRAYTSGNTASSTSRRPTGGNGPPPSEVPGRFPTSYRDRSNSLSGATSNTRFPSVSSSGRSGTQTARTRGTVSTHTKITIKTLKNFRFRKTSFS